MLSGKLMRCILSNRICGRQINANRFNHQSANQKPKTKTMKEIKAEMVHKLGVQTSYSPLLSSREYLIQYEPKIENLPPRTMQDSYTTAIIPLSTSAFLRDKYATFISSVRLGRLMEDMDLFAVWVVYQHLKILNLDPNMPLPVTIVTVLVDKISFTDLVPKHDSDIRLSGHVSWVGKSTIEVVVWMEQMCDGKWCKLTRALFLMASRNATNTKALAVNPLVPGSAEEKEIFDGGESRKKRRLELQKQSPFSQDPSPLEHKHIHDIFLRTIDMKNLTFNKRILPAGCAWMEDYTLSNVIFSHPEDRNAHNTVFGGFLMRHALELSWALVFQVNMQRPRLLHISDISFVRPVNVSSFIKMRAHLIFTEKNYMQIVVIAEVSTAETGEHNMTNVFYYTYSVPQLAPSIVPKTYHEAMWYLDGQRRFQNAIKLDKTTETPFISIKPSTK